MQELLLLYQAGVLLWLYPHLGTLRPPVFPLLGLLALPFSRLLDLVPCLLQSTLLLVRRALYHLPALHGPHLAQDFHPLLPSFQLLNPLVQMMSMWKPRIGHSLSLLNV